MDLILRNLFALQAQGTKVNTNLFLIAIFGLRNDFKSLSTRIEETESRFIVLEDENLKDKKTSQATSKHVNNLSRTTTDLENRNRREEETSEDLDCLKGLKTKSPRVSPSSNNGYHKPLESNLRPFEIKESQLDQSWILKPGVL
ncbi:hypothetical protein NDU88_001565 [Pleurodeles waltl]|uniref:Uncharacterized protein n=1 Tax=Pleurodeles waltl TaxID=8319 RepID=A0AAV7KR99_PLEWA|nr:hypothetical protein NDU88_001565 [Pleurodeles waltl]